jgi:hypothetical protein
MSGMAAVELAAHFVAAQQGGAERILRLHHPTSNGLCAGCLATPTDHPCQVARIAERALQLPTDPTGPPHPPRS